MEQYIQDRDKSELQQRAAMASETTRLALQDAPAHAPALPWPSIPPKSPAQPLANESSSLEDFENQAMDALKGKGSKRQGARCMKRPAASKTAESTPSATTSAPKKVAKASSVLTVWGCRRCRGNSKGCSVRWNPNFRARGSMVGMIGMILQPNMAGSEPDVQTWRIKRG